MKISIVGATAYTSRELIGLLARHPEAEIIHLGGRREGAPLISDVFTGLRGICDLPVTGMAPDDAPDRPDVAFFTLPHGLSHGRVPHYLASGIRCVDFSADYRFDDLSVYEAHYGAHKDPDNLARAVYGVPELFAEQIAGADLVGNPGCYPTGVVLALAPLAVSDLIGSGVTVCAMSGVSGRGNKPVLASMFCECNEDVRAYNVPGHRHEPEMEHALRLASGRDLQVTFVPHLVPMDRGILSTMVMSLARSATTEELTGLYQDFYAGKPFVRVCAPGKQPRTKDVAFTNMCDIAITVRDDTRAIVTSAIDNLLRGASSQAVQNMNVMFGLEEGMGLR
jgi:N-acetyl-gamma-glutamyl-phosphate reductase